MGWNACRSKDQVRCDARLHNSIRLGLRRVCVEVLQDGQSQTSCNLMRALGGSQPSTVATAATSIATSKRASCLRSGHWSGDSLTASSGPAGWIWRVALPRWRAFVWTWSDRPLWIDVPAARLRTEIQSRCNQQLPALCVRDRCLPPRRDNHMCSGNASTSNAPSTPIPVDTVAVPGAGGCMGKRANLHDGFVLLLQLQPTRMRTPLPAFQ